MSSNDKLLGGKMMGGISVGGKIYIAEEDVRHVVNAALATNEERNKRISELETTIAALKNPNRCPNCHLAYTDDGEQPNG